VFDSFCEKYRENPYELLEVKHIRSIRGAMTYRPEAANQMVKLVRQVLSFALENDLVRRNVARDVSYIRTGSMGFHAWSGEEVRQFESVHPIGAMARSALFLPLFTGQRRADAVGFGLQHVKDQTLHFTQTKGMKRRPVTLAIHILPELQKVIDATKTGQMIFLASKFGKPFTGNGFGNRLRKWCDVAALFGTRPPQNGGYCSC
jgi:integrase